MQGVRIRPFVPGDLAAILELERATFGASAWPREMFLEVSRAPSGLLLVAERGRSIAGYVAALLRGLRAEIVSIAVARRQRRSGIGTALLRRALRELERRGVRSVELMVRVDNSAAIRFYQRLGFRRLGRVPGYYEDGSDGLRMRSFFGGTL
ncbi:MAG: ribosomal protein S18-alanine N-acetyltransferase [Bryobacterales bacterium]|nr:ribosomal protein S18-alanine N-acetyltransferase [Bryobacteraceae bacterium]MDW8355968.1 ribosomal protein S18-alanine N-acetyltransferase [Bryobacterales bacterium]